MRTRSKRQIEEEASDDEAPEEVPKSISKQAATEQRTTERLAAKAAQEAAKLRKHKPQNKDSAQQVKQTSRSDNADASATHGNLLNDDEDLDLLPESVVAAVSQRQRNNQLLSERQNQQQAAVVDKPKRKKQHIARKVGPVVVQLLDRNDNQHNPSETALSFRQEQMNRLRRSTEMLTRTKVGGVRQYGSAKVFT